jgi:hypothetical protein
MREFQFFESIIEKSLYATRLAIHFYWAHWIMETRSLVVRPTTSSSPVNFNLLSASHK